MLVTAKEKTHTEIHMSVNKRATPFLWLFRDSLSMWFQYDASTTSRRRKWRGEKNAERNFQEKWINHPLPMSKWGITTQQEHQQYEKWIETFIALGLRLEWCRWKMYATAAEHWICRCFITHHHLIYVVICMLLFSLHSFCCLFLSLHLLNRRNPQSKWNNSHILNHHNS